MARASVYPQQFKHAMNELNPVLFTRAWTCDLFATCGIPNPCIEVNGKSTAARAHTGECIYLYIRRRPYTYMHMQRYMHMYMHVFVCARVIRVPGWLAGWLAVCMYVCMYVYSHLDKCIAHNAWHQRTRPRSPDVEEDTADMEDDIIVQVDAVQQEAATEDGLGQLEGSR